MRRLVILLALLLAGGVAPAQASTQAALEEVTGFGSNPGALRMFRYVPAGLGSGRPLVVAMHGCTQSAAAYDDEPGWVALADRLKFALVLPQQQSANNANSCFNWFQSSDTTRGAGEALSIKQMVDKALGDVGSDPAKVFATGLSAGGVMTSVMLATYPDVFAGGAVVAGIPYGCATSLVDAYSCMNPGKNLTPQQWGDKVRAASSYTGPWPKVSIWHGTADSTVAPSNLTESVDQWTNVHGTDQAADVSDTVDGYPHRGYKDASGNVVVDTYSITGMNHGQPISPGTGTENCGTPAPYILDVDSCAAYRIAISWGIAEGGGGTDPTPTPTTFAGIDSQDGYVKANADGSGAVVGTLSTLGVGRGVDGKDNRAILSFDTSAVPDDAVITRAWVSVGAASGGMGDPWSGGNRLLVDVRSGCFGPCTTDAADWSAQATTSGAATIPAFTSGTASSTDLSTVAAINKSGTTQLRLRFENTPASTAYRLLTPGPATHLHLAY